MVGNIVGMLVGAALDRQDGDSGLGGAVKGYLVEGAIRTVAPIAVTFAIGWAVQYAARRALHAVTGDERLERGAIGPDATS